MALVESLLTAIVRADGDALVMHVGEKPYVVASAGPIELSTQGLTLQAMAGMVAQLLPPEAQHALAEFGAVEHELPPHPQMQSDRFSIVVARGGDDVWIEVRRHRASAAPPVVAAEDLIPQAATAPEQGAVSSPAAMAGVDVYAPHHVTQQSDEVATVSQHTEPEGETTMPEPIVELSEPTPLADVVPVVETTPVYDVPSEIRSSEAADVAASAADVVAAGQVSEAAEAKIEVPALVELPVTKSEPIIHETEPVIAASYGEVAHAVGHTTSFSAAAMSSREGRTNYPNPPASPAAVIPMTRTLRIEVPPSGSHRQTPRASEVGRLLGIAASRNATALYLTTHTLPHIRVDAEMRVLEGELPMSSADIETAVAELMPEGSRDAAGRGEPTEWMAEFSGIGSVRCSTFRDHRGPGAIFQLISTRPMTAEQLGLPAEIQALATEAEGLVLVSSAQGHGKTSLVAALVDVINRQLPNYIITLETQVHLVHEHRNALISQRDVGGTGAQRLATARAALREHPDVLVIEDVSSAEMFEFALEAAGSGVLVIASVTAPSTTTALARAVEFFPQEDRRRIQALIAERLRGAVAQVLLRKAAGGRVAAREVLLATTSVTTLLTDGQLQDLPRAFESGRKFGLISMTEALVGLLRNGTIDLREAYRKADDRQALLAALRRENVDTSAIERLA